MILVLVIVSLFLIATAHIYMYDRLDSIIEYKKAVKQKDYGLYRSLVSSNKMLYTFWDWNFDRMIKPNFYKITGRTKTEVLRELRDIKRVCGKRQLVRQMDRRD